MAGDLYADELLADALTAVDGVGSFVSEEREAAVDAGGGVGEDAYAVAIDPLDGSSNLRSNNAMGTVVGVYDAPPPCDRTRPRRRRLRALRPPTTTMIVADDGGARR